MNIKKDTVIFMMKRFGCPEAEIMVMFDVGILDERVCRDVLIRDEYFGNISSIRKTDLKIKLSEKYCASFSTIEKIIAKK